MEVTKQPNSQEAEKAILNSIFWKNECIKRLDNIITKDDFYNPRHKIIYDCMIKLGNENNPIDLITMQTELNNRKVLDEIGGMTYLMHLQSEIPEVLNVEKYAQIIKDKALLRELIDISMNNIAYANNIGSRGIDQLFDEIESKYNDLTKKRIKSSGSELGAYLRKTLDYMRTLSMNEGKLVGVTSGFGSIDEITGGFGKGNLIILAARPAVGKTSLAMNMAINSAKKGSKVGILSLEMTGLELCMRLLATETDTDHELLRKFDSQNIDNKKIITASAELSLLKIYLDDSSGQNIMQLRATVRDFAYKYKIDILIIDYLQMIVPMRAYNGNRTLEITEITRMLKTLAKELEIPIICASQLSRKCEERMDKRPILSDLRDSGSIEQDADMVIFIYRDIMYNEDADPADAEILISKNRHGPTARLKMKFDATITKFYE